jgi:hypothetical protein
MRTTRFGNGAEKVRKITATKPENNLLTLIAFFDASNDRWVKLPLPNEDFGRMDNR